MRPDKPSATAYLIARSTYFLSRDPALGYLVPESAAELSLHFVLARRRFGRFVQRLTDSKFFRLINGALESATIPGIKLHYALRKRYLEEVARDSVANGVRQIVIIGAGFDTLSLRLHESFPETAFFEVDHPATQREKKLVAVRQHLTGSNLHFVALDLTRGNLEGALLAHSRYSPHADTLFVAEGLLMYLVPAEVDLIFQTFRRLGGLKSRIAFTFMEMRGEGRVGFRRSSPLVDIWLRFRNESFRWGMSRERVAGFLEERGFELREVVAAETLREKYLNSARLKKVPLAEGECICVAELDGKEMTDARN
jgi:methyltransferase (TIGR00027 family)